MQSYEDLKSKIKGQNKFGSSFDIVDSNGKGIYSVGPDYIVLLHDQKICYGY